MKNNNRIFFIIIILILFLLPIIFFNPKTTVSEKENRTLAEKPLLVKNNHFNTQIFSDYDNYLQDHLGLREVLIQLDIKNPLKIKSPINVEKAITGKNGWYFYTDPNDGNNLMDFYKRNLMDSNQIEKISKKILNTVEWCKNQNIKCIFLIGPNKHSVYEEFYPYERPDGITRADQITQIFNNFDVNFVFPRDFMHSKKVEFDYPLYYETDTHWNQAGAFITFGLLKNQLQSLFPDTIFPQIEYINYISESETYGDLLPMIKIKNAKSTQVNFFPIGQNNEDLYTYIKNDGLNGIYTKGKNNKLPRALIYRDSFFIALEPFVSPLFSEAEYHWKSFEASDRDYVLKYRPDIIIFESVERNAPDIIKN